MAMAIKICFRLSLRLDTAYFAENWKLKTIKKVGNYSLMNLLCICLIALFMVLDLKIKKIIKKKLKKKKKPDADVGSAKHASQTHPKDVVFFIFYFFIFKVG